MSEKPEKVEWELSQYLDGQLSSRQAAALEKRLAQDPQLRQELQRYVALEEHLSAMGREELAGIDYESQRSQIMAALERKGLLAARPRRVLIFRPVFGVLAAAAAVAIVATVALVLFGTKPPTQAPIAKAPLGPAPMVAVAGMLAPPAQRETKVSVQYPQMVREELPPAQEEAPADIPPGTVAVSFGRPGAMPPVTGGELPVFLE